MISSYIVVLIGLEASQTNCLVSNCTLIRVYKALRLIFFCLTSECLQVVGIFCGFRNLW